MIKKVSGDKHALAEAYAKQHPLSQENPGKVRGFYNEDSGKITIHGSGLKAHPLRRSQYPNGWELDHDVTPAQAQKDMANNFKELRQKYADAGAFGDKKPLKLKWLKAPTDMVRSVYGCESHRCKNVTVTPDYHQNNGTPVCDCDRDMVFLRVEIATNF